MSPCLLLSPEIYSRWRRRTVVEDLGFDTLLSEPQDSGFANKMRCSRTLSRGSTVVSPTPRSESSTLAESVRLSTTSPSAFTSSPTSMNS